MKPVNHDVDHKVYAATTSFSLSMESRSDTPYITYMYVDEIASNRYFKGWSYIKV